MPQRGGRGQGEPKFTKRSERPKDLLRTIDPGIGEDEKMIRIPNSMQFHSRLDLSRIFSLASGKISSGSEKRERSPDQWC
jgi:hypothetical protein